MTPILTALLKQAANGRKRKFTPHSARTNKTRIDWTKRASILFFCGYVSISPATSTQMDVVRKAIVDAVNNEESIPNDEQPRVNIPHTPIPFSEDKRFFWVPLTINYNTLSNSYCRMAIFDQSKSLAWIVSIQDIYNLPTCLGYRNILVEDLNGDGKKDFVAEVSIQSNRYPKPVSEAVVYLSLSTQEGNACYSKDASKAVVPSELWDSQHHSVPMVIERLRKMTFSCNAKKQ